MEKLSRLKVGWDVPWVTSWSGEVLAGPGPCRSVEGRLALRQTEKPGFGRPIYSLNHCRRQRESVQKMLCPMCGAPTTEDDRWTLTAELRAVGEMRASGLSPIIPPSLSDDQVILSAGSVAPMHKTCAERSAVSCPHLAADPHVELTRFPQHWSVAPLLVEARRPKAHALLAEPPRYPVVIAFLQINGITEARDPDWARRTSRRLHAP